MRYYEHHQAHCFFISSDVHIERMAHLCGIVVFRLELHRSTAICFAALIVLFSCGGRPEESSTQQILKHSKGGDFRGVKIGDDRASVSKTEEGVSVYSMPDELIYRIDPKKDDSTWYEISYNFSKDGLYDIKMDIYPKSDSALSALKNEFVTYYIEKYGECKYLDGYCHWRAMTENGHIVSITLTDSLSDKPRPRLKVIFHESQ